MSAVLSDFDALYHVSRGSIAIVDVPDLGFLTVEGSGAPDGDAFADAAQALYAVSHRVHSLLRKRVGQAPKVMPLEAQWWLDDPRQQVIAAAVALGRATMDATDRGAWKWRAMIVQPDAADAADVAEAVGRVGATTRCAALERLRFLRWQEGRCAQLLHIGPYADEGASIVVLHAGIAAAGYRPRGRHHEIYLDDPRRTGSARLRRILRHPVELLSA
jgi:hypothetical protein